MLNLIFDKLYFLTSFESLRKRKHKEIKITAQYIITFLTLLKKIGLNR